MAMTNKLHHYQRRGRILSRGDIVKVPGRHGGTFRILHFAEAGGLPRTDNNPHGIEVQVTCWGGRRGRRAWRTFTLDRIGRRIARAGSDAAEQWS